MAKLSETLLQRNLYQQFFSAPTWLLMLDMFLFARKLNDFILRQIKHNSEQ